MKTHQIVEEIIKEGGEVTVQLWNKLFQSLNLGVKIDYPEGEIEPQFKGKGVLDPYFGLSVLALQKGISYVVSKKDADACKKTKIIQIIDLFRKFQTSADKKKHYFSFYENIRVIAPFAVV